MGHLEMNRNQLTDIVNAANEIFCKGWQRRSEDREIGPRELHLELTYRCNLRCMMCDLWDAHTRLTADRKSQEIKLRDTKQMFSESRLLSNIDTVVLSGGEPFLADDFTEIVVFLKSLLPKSFIWILSNLYDKELIMHKLGILASRTDMNFGIGTSLDGIGEVHDRVRGQKEAFSKLLENIRQIRSSFPGIKLFASFTATPVNSHQLSDAYRLAAELDIPFSVQFSVERLAGRGNFLWPEEQLGLVEKQVEDILYTILGRNRLEHILQQIKGRTIPADLFSQIIYWGNLVKYQREKKRLFKNCPAGNRFIMLGPDKELYFCPILKYRGVGSAISDTIDTAWLSEKADKLRSLISGGYCHCWLNCIVYPLAVESISRERRLF